MKRVYLLTGRPGSGKTSLVKQLAGKVGTGAGGFYTEEIRSGGVRQGFRLVILYGENAVLAHTTIRSRYRVSKYGVDITVLDGIRVMALNRAARAGQLVVIDEIGKMELFSEFFRETVARIIAGQCRVLAVVMSSPHPWVDVIKRHDQVQLIEVTPASRDRVFTELATWLSPDYEASHR